MSKSSSTPAPLNIKLTRTIHPVGQGAFYSETFSDCNNRPVFTAVYDCGGKKDYLKKEIETLSTVDILFISHFHSDHINGVQDLIDLKSVVVPTAVTSVTLNQTSVSLKAGETVTLTATVKPDDATDKTVTWSTSNASVATVENGVVTGKKVGTATITATAGDKSATCVITVTATGSHEGITEEDW